MATCNLSALLKDACTNGFSCLDEKAYRSIVLELLCNLSQSQGTGGGTGASVPAGVILMWNGTIATVPTGWAMCDGTNGTPDLRNRFVVCGDQDAGSSCLTTVTSVIPSLTGGSSSHQHTTSGGGSGNLTPGGDIANALGAGAYSTMSSVGTTGVTSLLTTVPPYYSLAYIMKL